MKPGDLIIDKNELDLKDILVIEKIVSETEAIAWIRYTSTSIKSEQIRGKNNHDEFHSRNSRMNVEEIEADGNLIDLMDFRLVNENDFSPEIIAKAKEIL